MLLLLLQLTPSVTKIKICSQKNVFFGWFGWKNEPFDPPPDRQHSGQTVRGPAGTPPPPHPTRFTCSCVTSPITSNPATPCAPFTCVLSLALIPCLCVHVIQAAASGSEWSCESLEAEVRRKKNKRRETRASLTCPQVNKSSRGAKVKIKECGGRKVSSLTGRIIKQVLPVSVSCLTAVPVPLGPPVPAA